MCARSRWRDAGGLCVCEALSADAASGAPRCAQHGVVAFLFLTRMFIFTKRFSVTPTRNHDHHQLGCITPTDGRVKGVS